MPNKMLIDATHPEETRVVVVRENRVEEFDYESASKKQLRGNIYLAKVTRVEPSLQAAFVNYGGNRHGFLPFNEIHPDYYHLPLAERQALKQEEQRASRAAQARGNREDRKPGRGGHGGRHPRHEEAGAGGVDAEDAENGAETEADISPAELARAEAVAASSAEVGADEASMALQAALPETKYSGDLYAPSDAAQDEDDERLDATHDHDHDHDHDHAESEGDADYGHGHFKDDAGDDDDEDDVVEVINDDGEGSPPPERKSAGEDRAPAGTVESVGSEDALEELPDRVRRRRRNYKIQEVIKRGQIILVQVVKEERGNKGAALTTYLSLAGRYTVLMPNTGSGGGISRKISSPGDRKRLREIAGELDVPDGMGLIIRTAGASRTKSEIKRDYEYLLRLWENVRELTLKSSAPCLVYEEGDLIKRSIRDLYNRDIDEIQVAGEEAYRDAKDFMRMLMPSHAKNVQLYRDPEPIFIRHEVERQLNAMFSPQVTLPSGGYIVLNQTEALVAIDVNSGKSTREFSIEETALKTNTEASEEIARQLRLRDLAGLIVVDFIDMEEKRNNRSVERKLKECLRNDRARIQVGRISHFGLLEMSRQRLRTGMLEGSTSGCPTCQGTGFVRSTESIALSVLRGLEDWLRTNQPCNLNAVTATEVALYILNGKRGYLHDIETRYGVTLSISANDRVHGGSFLLEKLSPAIAPPPATNISMAVRQIDWADEPAEEDEAKEIVGTGVPPAEDEGPRSSRRRRRRRGGRGEAGLERNGAPNGASAVPWERDSPAPAPVQAVHDADDDEDGDEEGDGTPIAARAEGDEGENGNRRRSRRRGRRGGRNQRARQGREEGGLSEQNTAAEAGPPATGDLADAAVAEPRPHEADSAAAEPVQTEPVVRWQPDDAPAIEAVQDRPLPLPVAEPAFGMHEPKPEPYQAQHDQPQPSEFQEPTAARERRGYLNGNGAAHEEAPGHEDDVAEVQQADDRPEPVADVPAEAVVAEELKPRGTRRGWWQRREPD